MTSRTRIQKLGALFGAALTVSVGLNHILAPPAYAAVPALSLPGRVYALPNTVMPFAGIDPVSSDNRALQVSGLNSNSATCKQGNGNKYDISGCARIQMSLGNAKAGLLRIPGPMTAVDTNNDGKTDGFLTLYGSVINQSTDKQAKDSVLFHFNGTQLQIQDTLAAMLFVPCQQQIGTPVPLNPAPPIGSSPLDVDCGVIGGDPLNEPIYEETASLDSALPTLSILAIHNVNNVVETSAGSVVLKIEGTNSGPTVTVPAGAIPAPAGATTSLKNQVDVVDPDMCNLTICGNQYTNPGRAESDDTGLLVVWISENNCGTFTLLSYNGFTTLGGPSSPSIHQVIRTSTGMNLADAKQTVSATAIAAQVESTFDSSVLALDLSTQPSSASTPTKAFAGIAPLADVKYALSQIDYNAPTADATCHLNLAMSDLGNNGAPKSYVGSPFGPEKPFPADPNGDTVPYEIPQAVADSKSIQFDVKDTHPNPTIDQLQPGNLGDPAGPNKAAVFTVTFNQAIDPASLDATDFALQLNNAVGASIGSIVPITSGLVYSVSATASTNGTIKLTMPGTVYAAGHNTDATYANEPPTYNDNTIDWFQSGPAVTIDQKVGQADPTSVAPVRFTVKFSPGVSTLPLGFDATDIMLAGTAGATTAVITQPNSLDLLTYEVAVSGMAQSGTVIAAVKPGAIVDSALNPSAASSSIDNTVAWTMVVVDNTPPTATINQAAAQADPTSTSPLLFTVVFSEVVTGFATGDVTLSGTAGATTASVSGSGANYTVTVTGMNQSGTVIVSIPANVATDAAANGNTAATFTDNMITYHYGLTISTPGGSALLEASTGSQLTTFTTGKPVPAPPAGVTFPYGSLSFSATAAAGSLVTFGLTLPAPASSFYKVVGGAWQTFTFDGETGAQFVGNIITITIRDNGRGDSNPAAGIVADPGAPAVVQIAATTTTTIAPATTTTLAPATTTSTSIAATTTTSTTIAATTTTTTTTTTSTTPLTFAAPGTADRASGSGTIGGTGSGSAGSTATSSTSSSGSSGSSSTASGSANTGTTGSGTPGSVSTGSGSTGSGSTSSGSIGSGSTGTGAGAVSTSTTPLAALPTETGPFASATAAGPSQVSDIPLSFTGSETTKQAVIALALLALGTLLLAFHKLRRSPADKTSK